jgi:hypothetical protein
MNQIKNLFHFFKKRPNSNLPAFDFDKIKCFFENSDESQAYQVLTEQTCIDLDFDEFFVHINRTSSCIGQQYLYDRLRRIPHKSEMTGCDSTIQYLKNHKKFADHCQKLLSKLAHHDTYYICSLFQDKHPAPSEMTRKAFKVLQFIPLLFVAVFIISQKGIWLLFAGLFFLTNLILHYRNKQILFAYLYSIPQFLKMVFIAGKLSSETPLEQTNPDIKIRLQSLQPLVRGLAHFKFDVKLESEMAALVWYVKELINVFFLSEPNTLFRTFRLMEVKKADIEAVFSYVGHIDMLLSVVHLQENLQYYCKPQWIDADLQMTDIYHPLIEECIPNTLNTVGKSILLTGSNMSGKTTFIRTVALSMLSAQTLDICFARSFSGRCMKIHSAISLHDSLLESQSFYMKEVLSVKDMLEKSQQCGNNLFVLDEIFKGTNTPERIAASKAVLSVLSGNRNMVFVSTHDIELADLLAEEYELYHFCEQIEQNQLHFDYLLKRGKLKHRNAIRLLEIEGYPESVIADANKIAKKL